MCGRDWEIRKSKKVFIAEKGGKEGRMEKKKGRNRKRRKGGGEEKGMGNGGKNGYNEKRGTKKREES
jgi:hypothetical protein